MDADEMDELRRLIDEEKRRRLRISKPNGANSAERTGLRLKAERAAAWREKGFELVSGEQQVRCLVCGMKSGFGRTRPGNRHYGWCDLYEEAIRHERELHEGTDDGARSIPEEPRDSTDVRPRSDSDGAGSHHCGQVT